MILNFIHGLKKMD